jgi:hypothetical protein
MSDKVDEYLKAIEAMKGLRGDALDELYDRLDDLWFSMTDAEMKLCNQRLKGT